MSLWYISVLHFMLPSSQFVWSFRYCFINLTAIVKMVMYEVLTRILLHLHMLCQRLFRFCFCFVALITIKLQILHRQSENRNFRDHDCILQFLSIFSILSRFSFLYWLSCSFIGIHCFFQSVTNLQSYSGCSSPLPFPQSYSAHSPPWALVTSVDWFMGAVPGYWGCLTSIALKHFPHISHLKVTLGPG